jgi:acetoin:2,6-dichlorophenolindophenol oxidoreductase subunit alpha
VVFINENNLYGISSCTSVSMCVPNIADRASAYDIPGIVVDGNDVMAVYEAAKEAIARARAGKGPTLIECKTYRHRGHFEGDPCVYRSQEEVDEWKAKDPIPRFEKQLLSLGVATPAKIEEIRANVAKQIEAALKFAQDSPFPDPSEILDDVYTV